MSQQGLRQASVRAESGTTLTYEGDWHAMWDGQSIETGTFNERLLLYINEKLGTTFTNINDAMQALAASVGATNFGSMGTFDASLTASTGASTLLGSETDGLAFSASDDSMEIRDTVTPANNYVGSAVTKFGNVRASAGTYYDVSGVLQSSASGLRRDYDPRVAGPKYLCEPAATNLVWPSADGTTFAVGSGSGSWSAATDITGASSNCLLTITSGAYQAYLPNSYSAAAAPYTHSIYAKAGTVSQFRIGDGSYAGAHFDLALGICDLDGGGYVGRITPSVNGWYRCSVTFTPAAGTQYLTISQIGVGTIHFGEWQVEAGSFATSYIPTTSAAVTRAADLMPQWTALNISQTAVTIYAKFVEATQDYFQGVMSTSGGTGDQESGFIRYINYIEHTVVDGGVNQYQYFLGGISMFVDVKMAMAYALNDFASCVNGGTVNTDSAGTLPTTTALNIFFMRSSSVNFHMYGWMSEALQVNTRKSNAALQALTT